MELPPVKLDFLKALTDDTGIIQHAKFSIPCRKEGYTTDDNARALIASIKHLEHFEDASVRRLIDTYLCLLLYMQRADGKMHNFLSYDRRYIDEVGSEECIGNTVWACGYAQDSKLPLDTKLVAKEIFDKALPWTIQSVWPRVKALAIMGLFHYQRAYPADKNISSNIRILGDQLLTQYRQQASDGWNWFEPCLTYSNGRLPQALFLAYEATKERKYLQAALSSLNFLIDTQTIDGIFVPIGNDGWYKKGATRAVYDQQPIEAWCMIDAEIAAYRITQNESYRNAAYDTFEWFLGKNLNGLSLYDPKTGGCCDGITPQGLNYNRGAESNISYLMARLNLESLTQVSTQGILHKQLTAGIRRF